MTPREAMAFRTKNDWFDCTFGCVELEQIAQVVLAQLCWSDNWGAWLSFDFFGAAAQDNQPCKWRHWHGSTPCSFDKYILYSPNRDRFQVTEKFIYLVSHKGSHAPMNLGEAAEYLRLNRTQVEYALRHRKLMATKDKSGRWEIIREACDEYNRTVRYRAGSKPGPKHPWRKKL